MSRSTAQGAHRRPGSRPHTPAPVAAAAPAPLTWDQAERALTQAVAEIDGSPWRCQTSALLLGPLSRQHEHAAQGGDPAVYDEDIVMARRMLTGTLTFRGDTHETAAAKIANLETAYTIWLVTPETRTR